MIAADTFGATEALPAYLEVVGEVPMGRGTRQYPWDRADAATAYTGGMLAARGRRGW